jgi:hypothetical protein
MYWNIVSAISNEQLSNTVSIASCIVILLLEPFVCFNVRIPSFLIEFSILIFNSNSKI